MLSTTVDWAGTPFPVSTQQITDIVSIDGTRTHAYATQHRSYRVRILDSTLTPVGTGSYGPKGDPGDITPWIVSCAVSQDATLDAQGAPTRPVHGQATIVMREAVGFVFDPTQHFVQVFVDFWTSNDPTTRTLLAEVPVFLGMFLFPDRDLIDSGTVWTCTLADLSGLLQQCLFVYTYGVAAGSLLTTVMTALATMDTTPKSLGGTGQTPAGLDDAGPGFPATRVNITPSTQTLATGIPLTDDMTKLAAMNAFGQTLIYYPVRVDALGILHAHPKPDFSQSIPAAAWRYSNNDASSIINGAVSERWADLTRLYNIVKLKSANSALPAPLGTVVYNNATTKSRIAIGRCHRAMQTTIQDDKITDVAILNARAHIELQYAAVLAEQITFQASPNPWLEVHDLIAVDYHDPATGTLLLTSDHGFEVLGYDLDLDAWTQRITAGRAVLV